MLLGLSGGVDSSVVAALLNKAIGDQLTCIFVDNGLLRLDEGDQVMNTFAKHLNVRVIRVNAEDIFLNKLKGITDPEEKRKIIGNTFIEVFEEEANKISTQAATRGTAVHQLAEDYLNNSATWSKGAMPSNLFAFNQIKPIKMHTEL